MAQQMVGIFWDFENVPPPEGTSGYETVRKILQFAKPFGPVSVFKAYLDVNQAAGNLNQYHGYHSSGVSMIHTPHNGSEKVAHKVMIADFMLFALETSSPKTIVLITSDKDLDYVASILRFRGHTISIVHPFLIAPFNAANTAHHVFNWYKDVLGSLVDLAVDHPDAAADIVNAGWASEPDIEDDLAPLPSESGTPEFWGSYASEDDAHIESLEEDREGICASQTHDAVLSAVLQQKDFWRYEDSQSQSGEVEEDLGLFEGDEEEACYSYSIAGSPDIQRTSLYDRCETEFIRDTADLTNEPALLPTEALPAPSAQKTPAMLGSLLYYESLPNMPGSLIPGAISTKPSTLSATAPPFIPPSRSNSQRPPGHFMVLMDVLNQMEASTTRPLKRSAVAQAFRARLGGSLKKLGYNTTSYFEKAEELGLIRLFSQYEKKETGRKKIKSVLYLTLAPSAEIESSSAAETIHIPQAGVSATMENLNQGPSSIPTMEWKYDLLIDVLKKLGASQGGSFKPSIVANALLCRDAGFFYRLSFGRKQYFNMAMTAGIIQFAPGKRGRLVNIVLAPEHR